MSEPAGSRAATNAAGTQPPNGRPKVRLPGPLRFLRFLLVMLGLLMLIGLVQFAMAGLELPPLSDAYGWATILYPVGLVLGFLIRPNRRVVHILILGYELVLACLWVAIMSAVPDASLTAWGAVAVPIVCIGLALTPSSRRYFWDRTGTVDLGSARAAAAGVSATADSGPVTLNVGRRLNTQILIGAVVGLFFGGCGLYGAFNPETVDGGVATQVIAGILGGIFGLIGLVMLIAFAFLAGVPRTLTFDEHGISWAEPRGLAFSVEYAQLATVIVSTGNTPSTSVSPRKTVVRLVMVPTDGQAPDQRMERLRTETDGQTVYLLPLGANPRYIEVIDQAMRRFGPEVYAGVQEQLNIGIHLT